MTEPKHTLRCHCDSNEAGPEGMRKHGALVRVEIGPSPDDPISKRTAKLTSVPVLLMVDTGAHQTFVNDEILQRLGLPAAKMEPIYGIFPEAQDCPIYRLAITLRMVEDEVHAQHMIVLPLAICGLPSSTQPWHSHGLLGRDFLEGVGLDYDGPTGTCSMNWQRHVRAHSR